MKQHFCMNLPISLKLKINITSSLTLRPTFIKHSYSSTYAKTLHKILPIPLSSIHSHPRFHRSTAAPSTDPHNRPAIRVLTQQRATLSHEPARVITHRNFAASASENRYRSHTHTHTHTHVGTQVRFRNAIRVCAHANL